MYWLNWVIITWLCPVWCKANGTGVWGVLLLCPRRSSPCRRRPSYAFEISALHKGYSPPLAGDQERRACLFWKSSNWVHLFFWKRGCGKEHSSMHLVMLCCTGIKITSCKMIYSTYAALMRERNIHVSSDWIRKTLVIPKLGVKPHHAQYGQSPEPKQAAKLDGGYKICKWLTWWHSVMSQYPRIKGGLLLCGKEEIPLVRTLEYLTSYMQEDGPI